MENEATEQISTTNTLEVHTDLQAGERQNNLHEGIDNHSPESSPARESLDDRIIRLNTDDTEKLLTIRQRLGLVPKKISEWLHSKEGHPKTNILYRANRMYRCIGPTGYKDFINTGSVRSKNKDKYQDVSFNIGEPAPLYMKESSGDFILEATEKSANFEFKTNPYSWNGEPMKDIPYRSCLEGELTKESAIRIFERTTNNTNGSIYKVVFDNIGDEALIESK